MAQRSTTRTRALAELMRPDATRWVALGILLAGAAGLSLVGPLVVRRVVDQASRGTTTAEITRLAAIYLIIAVATQMLGVIVAWFATTIAWRTVNGVRMRMARHVLGLDHEFHRQHTPGELIQRVDGDVTAISDFLGQVVPRLVSGIFVVAGMIVALALIDWRIASGAAIYVGLSAAVVIRSRHRAVIESSDEMGSFARLYGGIEERLTAAEDLRSNGALDHALWRLTQDSAETMRAAVRRESAFLRMWWAVQGCVGGGSIVALVASALLLRSDTISIGTAFLLFQYVQLLSRPLEQLVQQLETVQKAHGAMTRVIDLMAVRATIVDNGRRSPRRGPLSVEFADVSFAYDDDERVLDRVNLFLQPGSSIGIVGRSGSGKTTMSRLVLRLVEATTGIVKLGDVPIADISFGELRRRVALIPQEVELVSGSVKDNVTLFDDSIGDADVAAALYSVGLQRLVEAGIDRELGANGMGLSAGEGQLLALARVWLRQPDLMVLDEATARVDPETERLLDAALGNLMRGRTTIIIAHRLSTLQHVDQIVVFDNGTVVEHGDRAALVSNPISRFQQLRELALDSDGGR